MFGYSHTKFISQMANVIADHGHNVTLFQPYHIDMKNTEWLVKNKNIEVLNYYPDHFEELTKIKHPTFPVFWDSKVVNNPVLSAFIVPKLFCKEFERTATQTILDEDLHEQLRIRKFDVALVEVFEISGFYIADLLNIPSIPIASVVRLNMYHELFGQPSTVGYVPTDGSKMSPEAGILDRFNDFYRIYFDNLLFENLAQRQNDYIEAAFGRPVPKWRDLISQSPIYITNSNSYLDFAVPTTATVVHVGGITMNLKKSVGDLPEEYEKILQERDSTVLISFGSVVRSFEMPDNFKAGIIRMFESLPNVTFIWKYEKDDVEFQNKLPKNVHLKKWVPQHSFLSDSRLKVFVTHGGLGSTMEVAYSGKPALMIPVFGDQPHNALMLERHGGAIAYDKFGLADGEKLERIMKDLVTNPKYEENAKKLQEVLHNQPIDPKLNLMKHLEFAIQSVFPLYL
uniref:glucuronosyltransferase n=1 Tax=Caenorhabditis tropicalis TaxID=1561998 RepID=A0A1I7UEK4_9PELO